jgi:hypothetical protein
MNLAVTDFQTGQAATSLGTPQLVPDRFGVTNGAVWVNGGTTAWQVPAGGRYFRGDSTLTLWLKKIVCVQRYGDYGIEIISFFFKVHEMQNVTLIV